MIRTALVLTFAFGLALSGTGSARAESDEADAVDPGAELFRQALADYRGALAELRDICEAGEDTGVANARRRAPKRESTCERGMRELRTFLVEARKAARELTKQVQEDREARRVAAEEEERQAREREEKEVREEEEAREAERRETEARQRAAEKARQEQQKKQEQEKKAAASQPKLTDAARKVEKLREQLRGLEETIAYKARLQAESATRAAESRAIAGTKAGPEREKYLHKAAEMDRQAAEWGRYVAEYSAKRDEVRAALAALPR